MQRLTPRERCLIAALAVAYAVLGFAVLDPEVPYTGDIGVKFVQARALAAHGFASLDIPYPGEFLDPSREFLPMREPFIMKSRGETQAIFPPAFAIVQAVVVMAAGFHGLVLLSVLGGALILFAVAKLAPAGRREWAVLAAGLAGPLWFYASSSWEHAPGVALGAAAFAAVFCWRSPSAPLAAGLLLGAGTTIRDEVFLLLPGLLVGVWLARRSLKPLLLATAGVFAPIAAAAAIDVFWFGRPAFAHVRHAVTLVEAAAAAPAANDVPTLVPMAIAERYQTVIEYWLLGYGDDRAIAAMAVAFAIALLVRWRFRSAGGIVVWCLAVVAFAAADVYELLTAPKWIPGMHRIAPYLVFALLPAAVGFRRDRFRATVIWTTAAYVGLALAVVDTAGGKGLGPRLLLPLFPLLAVAAVVAIGEYLQSNARLEQWAGRLGAALVIMTMAMHLFGALPAYYVRNREDATLLAAVMQHPQRIVVTEDQFTAQLLFPLYHRKIILLADTPDLAARLGAALDRQHLREALMVTRRGSRGLELPPLTNRRSQLWGRLTIQQWQR